MKKRENSDIFDIMQNVANNPICHERDTKEDQPQSYLQEYNEFTTKIW
jgi:hypothetical protein